MTEIIFDDKNNLKHTVTITIWGNVSSGKSTWPDRIQKLCEQRGLSVFVTDQHIFSFRKSFKADLQKVNARIAKECPDFAVITIGTGNDRSLPFRIDVEPYGYSAISFMNLLTGTGYNLPPKRTQEAVEQT